MRVAVIGAGLAGLVAADELEAAGAEVAVLEARERVGGRTWSRRLGLGATIELGAEFVLPGNVALRALAERLGLRLGERGMSYGRREPRGQPGADVVGMELAAAKLAARLEEIAATPGAGAPGGPPIPSAAALIGSLEVGEGVREALRARVEVSAAAPAEAVSARDLAALAHVDSEPAVGVAGGNQALALALAGRLGGSVHTSAAVRRIAWGPGGVTLEGERWALEADRCVIAVPASVIGRIEIDPPLGGAAARALAGIRYGQAAKLFVPLRGQPEPSAVLSVPERYWCWTAFGADGRPPSVLNCFAGSAAALERLELGAGSGAWLESVARLRPDLDLVPGEAVLSTWGDDPWAGGAYSVSAGPATERVLAEPVGPLVFAGEHTAGAWAALMEGAIRSGERAARTLAMAI